MDWYFVDRTLISSRKYYPPQPLLDRKKDEEATQTTPVFVGERRDCGIVQIVTSSPISPWPDIMQGYVRILMGAKRYVYMESPYFLPTEPVLFAMRTAALAGIDIRLMIPAHTDAKLVEWASRSYVKEAVEAGVKVHLYEPCFNHSKLLVCDDSLCTCGSTNVDFRSFENNFEANAFFYDRDMALRMKKVFMDDVANSTLLEDVANMEKRPFLNRLWESLLRMLSPLL